LPYQEKVDQFHCSKEKHHGSSFDYDGDMLDNQSCNMLEKCCETAILASVGLMAIAGNEQGKGR
jgi:hypothetical protein